MSFPGWSTTVFIFCDSCSWVSCWSWADQKNPPAPAHSLIFQHLLHIWTLSKSDCMILRSIFSHWGQLRDSYTTITKGENIYWCSRRQHNIKSRGMCKFFSFCLTIIFFSTGFRSYINTYMFPRSTIYPDHPIQKVCTPNLLMHCGAFLSYSTCFHLL